MKNKLAVITTLAIAILACSLSSCNKQPDPPMQQDYSIEFDTEKKTTKATAKYKMSDDREVQIAAPSSVLANGVQANATGGSKEFRWEFNDLTDVTFTFTKKDITFTNTADWSFFAFEILADSVIDRGQPIKASWTTPEPFNYGNLQVHISDSAYQRIRVPYNQSYTYDSFSTDGLFTSGLLPGLYHIDISRSINMPLQNSEGIGGAMHVQVRAVKRIRIR